jgi:putative ABC transport system permease protein
MPFGFPFLAYGGILSLIAGFTLLSPSYLSIILGLFRGSVEKIFGPTGKIARGDMMGNIYRFSVALMSVAVSCALVIALLTLISSFRKSLVAWIESTIAADVYVKPASCVSNFCSNPLPDDIVPIIESLPEVKGIDRFRSLEVELFGRKVVAGFADLEAQRKFSPLHGDRERRERAGILERSRQLSISHYLSMQYGLKKGDVIELPTAKGNVAFKIFDTFTSYSTASGFIFMDRKWLREYWGLDDATQVSVYLKESSDPDLFVRKLREKVAGRYALEILNNHDLRGKVLTIFERSFAVTYAIELISIIVSLIGVVNSLLAFVLERKREISIFRYLGGSWNQIRQVLVLSAGVVGISGILLGSVIGSVMSVIFIRVINEISFGWRVDFSVPVLYLSFVGVVLFFTTLLAGYLPSRVAEKIDPMRHISFE